MSIIRVIDFETTGKEPPAEVCEWGWSDYDVPTGTVRSPTWDLCRVAAMPPEARAVHHITLAETARHPPFDPANLVGRTRGDGAAALAAHNMAFEAQWLGDTQGLHLICTYKAALRVWPDAPAHNNGTLRYWLEDQGKLPVLTDLTGPMHRAGSDSYVTAYILKALFDAGATGKDMVAWQRQPALLPRCPIGDHRDKPWHQVPLGFLEWMTRKADMDSDLKWNAQQEIDRRARERGGALFG